MLMIGYDKAGTRVPDANVEKWVDKKVKSYLSRSGKDMVLSVANDLAILAFRVAVKEGKISHKEIIFTDLTTTTRVDKNGNLEHSEFIAGNIHTDLLERLIF